MVLFLLRLAATGNAADEAVAPLSPAAAEAECLRLREELQALARKNAWSGVERTYLSMLALGAAPLRGADHHAGAQAAAARGDLDLATQRLRMALATGEEVPGAREWLADLARRFGRIRLEGATLEAAAPPFAPDERDAVAHAAHSLQATGFFDGMLPAGRYLVDGEPVTVRPTRPEAR